MAQRPGDATGKSIGGSRQTIDLKVLMAGRKQLSEEDKMISSLKNIINLQVADQKVNIIDDLDKLFQLMIVQIKESNDL